MIGEWIMYGLLYGKGRSSEDSYLFDGFLFVWWIPCNFHGSLSTRIPEFFLKWNIFQFCDSLNIGFIFRNYDQDVAIEDLRKQLREKDLVLTDIRLEALSSAHQLESLKDTVIKMRVRVKVKVRANFVFLKIKGY